MKKTIVLLLCVVFTIALAGCQPKETASTKEDLKNKTAEHILIATITEIQDGALLVTPVEGSQELNSSDSFSIPIHHLSNSFEPQVGDTIEISYNGVILESYPARLGEIYSITIPK